MLPIISICIPAYKNPDFLRRLLASIASQDYEQYEVIISDDSPDDQVRLVVDRFNKKLSRVSYWKNQPAKGMPQNWNFALAQAKGQWIKMMHDDDWFSAPDSLAKFAAHITTQADFIFCDYENVFFNQKAAPQTVEIKRFSPGLAPLLRREPLVLLADNQIGPPSVCMVRNGLGIGYDERLRWRVDIDYYARVLKGNPSFVHISEPLIKVGMNADQVTNVTKNRPEVELPEAYILLQKYGTAPLKNWRVYDAWWRMMRNMHIYNLKTLEKYAPGDWGKAIIQMMIFLSRVPKSVLHTSIGSKLFMGISFLTNSALKRSI